MADELTTGRASVAKGVLAATSSPPGTSLLAAWEKYKRSQEGAQKLGRAADGAADLEQRALRKSRASLEKALRKGVAASVACDVAHRQYRLAGGKARFSDWAVKVAEEA